jgi:predicted RNase H-like nuclease (RuvC/YqgF family)
MVHAMTKPERFRDISQSAIGSSRADDASLYYIAIIGVAAGFTLAIAIWLVKSTITTDNLNILTSDSTITIKASEIREANKDISQLNKRVESLSASIAGIEKRISMLNKNHANSEKEHLSSLKQESIYFASAKPTNNSARKNIVAESQMSSDEEKPFVPTHTVNERLNLRESSSLDARSIAVLKPGLEVEYITDSDGWYYVNTQSHGKGWCYSDYLSFLSPTQ